MKKITNFFRKLIQQKQSPHKLALSFAIGAYIAFSPYLGLHTLMVFAFTWLFGLNLTTTFAAAYGINNPWTAIPVYSLDYFLGHWLLHAWLLIDFSWLEPSYFVSIRDLFEQKLHIAFPCLWSFFLGGNLLGIIIGVMLYPIMKLIFTKLLKQELALSHEDHHQK